MQSKNLDGKINMEKNENKNIQERLEEIKNSIRKEFGKESVFTLSDREEENTEVISTGSINLDQVVGNGGIRKGRVIEIFGPESSGKTTVALHIVKAIQDTGGVAAFVDAEHALDLIYAEKIGVRTNELLLSQPNSGEEAFEFVSTYIENQVDVVIVDSVAALVPKAELDGDMGDSHMGLHARLMGKGLRKITPVAAKSGTIIIFINQLRQKVGVLFGNPETTSGGNALKFFCSLRLDLRRKETIKNPVTEEIIGNKVKIKGVKNKCDKPFVEKEITIYYNEGIKILDEIVNIALEMGIVTRSGSWYSLGDKKIGQGADSVIKYFKENPEVKKTIEKQIIDKLFTNTKQKEKKRNEKLILEKMKTIQEAMVKKFGKESVFTINETNKYEDVVSTGSIKIDEIIGNNGLVPGRIIEIFGAESSGKTTLCLHIIKSVQEMGGLAAYIDVENALDIEYAKKIGVKTDELLLSQPNSGEEALTLLSRYIDKKISVVVLDSVAALAVQAEIEGEMIDSHIGLVARLMSQALRKITHKTALNKAIVIFVNQLRSKIGTFFGNPESTTGGNALKYYSSLRLELRKKDLIKGGVSGDDPLGNRSLVKCIKNKVSAPGKETIITIDYNQGISLIDEILSLGVEYSIIEKSGNYYNFAGKKLGQGVENTLQFLKENKEITEKIKREVMEKIKNTRGKKT